MVEATALLDSTERATQPALDKDKDNTFAHGGVRSKVNVLLCNRNVTQESQLAKFITPAFSNAFLPVLFCHSLNYGRAVLDNGGSRHSVNGPHRVVERWSQGLGEFNVFYRSAIFVN